MISLTKPCSKDCEGFFVDAETAELTKCDACNDFTSDKEAQDCLVVMPQDEFGFQVVFMHPKTDYLTPLADFKTEKDATEYLNKLKGVSL